MASGAKRFFQLMFGIGGNLDPSFKASTKDAKDKLTELEKQQRKSAVEEAARMRELHKNWDESKKHFSEFSENLGKAYRQIGDTLKWVAVSSAAATGALYAMAQKTANLGEDAMAMHSKYGIQIQDYTALSHAATMAGTSQETYNASIRFLTRNMTAALQGNKQAELAFRRANVTLKDSHGKVKGINQVMLEMSDTFKKMPEGIYKGSLAMAVFGKNGADMTMLMEEGSKVIKEQEEQARQLGIVFDEDAGNKSLAFNASMRELKALSAGLMYTLGKALLPVLTQVNEKIFKWSLSNSALIRTKINEWVQKFADYLPKIYDGVMQFIGALRNIWTVADGVVQTFGGWSRVLRMMLYGFVAIKALGMAFFFLQAGASLVKMFTSFMLVVRGIGLTVVALKGMAAGFWALNAALLANPITWIVVAIVAVIGVIALLYYKWDTVVKYFKLGIAWITEKWDQFCKLFKEKFPLAYAVITKVWSGLVAFIGPILSAIAESFKTTFRVIAAVISWQVDVFKSAWHIMKIVYDAVVGFFRGDFGAFGAWLGKIIKGLAFTFILQFLLMKRIFTAVLDFFFKHWTDICAVFKAAWEVVSAGFRLEIEVIKYVFEAVVLFLKTAWDGLCKFFTSAFDIVAPYFEAVWNGIKAFFTPIVDNLRDTFKDGFIIGIVKLWEMIDPVHVIWNAITGLIKQVLGVDNYNKGVQFIGTWLDGILGWLKSKGVEVAKAAWDVLPKWAQKMVAGGAQTISKDFIEDATHAQKIVDSLGFDSGVPQQVTKSAAIANTAAPTPIVQAAHAATKAIAPEVTRAIATPAVTQSAKAMPALAPSMPVVQQAQAAAPIVQPIINVHTQQAAGTPPVLGAGAAKKDDGILAFAKSKPTGTTATYNFNPTVNISSGTDPSVVKKAVDDALKQAQGNFNKWAQDAQLQSARVAMR